MLSSTAGEAMRRVAWLVFSSLVRTSSTMPCMASVEASERASRVLSSSVWVSGVGSSVGVCSVVVTSGWVVVTGGRVVVVVEVDVVVCIGGWSVVVGVGAGSVVVVVVVVSGTVVVVVVVVVVAGIV